MAWNRFCRAALAIAAASFMAASGAAQDNAANSGDSARLRALTTPSIRPLRSEEKKLNKPTALYEKGSDEMQHFREELGKKELSTKAKKRIAEIEARVVYSDPMEKPAEDGSKFINIYDESEIFADGKPYYDPEDPDVKYEKDEKNFLALLDETLQSVVAGVQVAFGVSGATQGGADGSKGGYDMGMASGPAHVMPTVSGLDPSVAPGGGPSMDPLDTKDGGKQEEPKPEPTGPSEADDSELIFDPNLFAKETGDNPFLDAKDGFLEGDADLFKEDREFKPAPPANANAGGYGPGGGNATEGMDFSIPRNDKPMVEP